MKITKFKITEFKEIGESNSYIFAEVICETKFVCWKTIEKKIIYNIQSCWYWLDNGEYVGNDIDSQIYNIKRLKEKSNERNHALKAYNKMQNLDCDKK